MFAGKKRGEDPHPVLPARPDLPPKEIVVGVMESHCTVRKRPSKTCSDDVRSLDLSRGEFQKCPLPRLLSRDLVLCEASICHMP